MKEFKEFTQIEIEYLYANYGKEDVSVLAKFLSRSVGSILTKAHRLKLTKQLIAPQHRWINQEIDFLLKFYVSMGAEYCAKALNISIQRVRSKASELKLNRKFRNKWDENKITVLINHCEIGTPPKRNCVFIGISFMYD